MPIGRWGAEPSADRSAPPPVDQLWLKCENLQHVCAFKARGAYHFVSRLTDEAREAGLITYSSGNHAQAVAFAARAFGTHATIVMPVDAPLVKLDGTRRLGADVEQVGTTSSERRERAEEIQRERGGTMVPPFDHPDIIEFIGFKDDLSKIQNYNVSVAVTNRFLDELQADPATIHQVRNPRTLEWKNTAKLDEEGNPTGEFWTVGEIWDLIINHAWRTGEPGIVFIDRVNEKNPIKNVGGTHDKYLDLNYALYGLASAEIATIVIHEDTSHTQTLPTSIAGGGQDITIDVAGPDRASRRVEPGVAPDRLEVDRAAGRVDVDLRVPGHPDLEAQAVVPPAPRGRELAFLLDVDLELTGPVFERDVEQ